MYSPGDVIDTGADRINKLRKEEPVEIVVFGVVSILWIAFGAALLFSESEVREVWQWYRDRSTIVQAPLGILFLPWVIGMWIWETSWHVVARGAVVAGLAWASAYMFSPWRA